MRCRVVVALQKRERGRGREGAAALVRWSVLGFLERSLQAAAPLDDVTAHVPEATQRHGDCELQLTFPSLMEMVERRAKAVVLGFENVEPLALAIAAQMRRRLVHERLAPLRVAASRELELGRVRLELAGRELVDRLEKQEPLPAPAFGSLDEMVIDERGDRVEGRVAHTLGGVERAPAREDGQPGECSPLFLVQQVDAPGDRLPEGLLPRRQVSRAAGEQAEPRFEPLEQRLRRQCPDACRGQLDCEWQAVDAAADLADVALDGGRERERRIEEPRPLREQLNRVVLDQGCNRDDLLSRHVQDDAARHQERQTGSRGDELAKPGAASRRCSTLSRTSRSSCGATAAASASSGASPGSSVTPRARAIVGRTSA